ncbi:MAG: glycosyltransferase [Halobacteriaceae archaeon]
MAIRVIHEGDWLYPGGAERVAKEIAQALNAPITVGTTGDPSFWNDVDATLAFQDSFQTGVTKRLHSTALRSYYELRRAQKFRSIEFSEETLITTGTAAKWIVPKYNQTHIHYCHVPPPRFYGRTKQGMLSWLAATFGGMYDRYFTSFCDHIIANSQFTKQRVQKHYNREATVINPPIRIDRFYHDEPTEQPYFVMIGRLNKMKRADIVAKAFAGQSEAHLVMIGDGPLEDLCKRQDNVSVYTDIADLGVEIALSRCNGGIAFARQEHCGMTPKEIQAAGKPVIVPDEPNLHNHVEDGKTGVIVTPNTAGVQEGIHSILQESWNPATIQSTTQSWSIEQFHANIQEFVNNQI